MRAASTPERPRLVLVLRAVVLAFDDDAGRQMRHAHRRVGLVHVLTAGAGSAIRVDLQLRGVQHDVGHLVRFGQHGHRARGGMDATLRLGIGTRCTRCAPDSNLSLEYAPWPTIFAMISR
jgi:hypothetical protein